MISMPQSLLCSGVQRRDRSYFFFFQAEDGIRDYKVTGVQTCALPILTGWQDPNVPARTTMEMYYALRRLGKKAVWVNYVNSGHGTPHTTEADFRDYHSRILSWFDTYLKTGTVTMSSK